MVNSISLQAEESNPSSTIEFGAILETILSLGRPESNGDIHVIYMYQQCPSCSKYVNQNVKINRHHGIVMQQYEHKVYKIILYSSTY